MPVPRRCFLQSCMSSKASNKNALLFGDVWIYLAFLKGLQRGLCSMFSRVERFRQILDVRIPLFLPGAASV